MTRVTLVILAALLANPASAQGQQAVTGLNNIAQQLCGWTGGVADPSGLAAALDGPLGDVMGFRDSDSLVGSVYASDPRAGAQMWASNGSRRSGGCEQLVAILNRPASQVLADLP